MTGLSGWRVGAVAEKDPGVPWTQLEIQQRVWDSEMAIDRQRVAVAFSLLAGGVAGAMAVLALWRSYAR